MLDTNEVISILTLVVLALLLVGVLVLIFRRSAGGGGDVMTAVGGVDKSLQQAQTQIAVLTEKLAHLEPATQNIQNTVNTKLGEVQQGLTAIYAHVKARQEMEQQANQSIRRIEAVIAGTQSKGAAGENVVEAVFAKLPIEWQIRNFTVNGKIVEFGIRLPNGLIVPIDSKWPATNLIEELARTEDPDARARLKGEIDKAVLGKAREVSKYIDPSVTMPLGVAVIPDAVYELSGSVLTDAFQLNVVLVSYSMFVPYLLLLVQTALRTMESIDLQRLDAYLRQVQAGMSGLQEELDGRFARAMTMLGNSRDDMRATIGKVSGGVTSLQMSTSGSGASLPGPDEES